MGNNFQFIIFLMIALLAFSCKNKDKIILETAIDHFEYNNIILAEHAFKKLTINENNRYYQDAQNYLSRITMVDNNKGDTIIHNNNEGVKNTFIFHEEVKNIENIDLHLLFNNTREYINKLYTENEYELALKECENLIWVFDVINKNNEKKYNTEVSQIYQDMSVIYAKKNNLDTAKIMIQKAIDLNPSDQNQKILELIS